MKKCSKKDCNNLADDNSKLCTRCKNDLIEKGVDVVEGVTIGGIVYGLYKGIKSLIKAIKNKK